MCFLTSGVVGDAQPSVVEQHGLDAILEMTWPAMVLMRTLSWATVGGGAEQVCNWDRRSGREGEWHGTARLTVISGRLVWLGLCGCAAKIE